MISAHNQARRQYGSGPLVWDEGLARDAAVYARKLARSGRFEHDPQVGRRPHQGENLWVGTRSAYSYAEMIGLLHRRLVAGRALYADRLARDAAGRLCDGFEPIQ